MKAKDIVVGGKYTAKVSGKLTTVRVDQIRARGPIGCVARETVVYDVTNLTTGRKLTFHSAAKFRRVVGDPSGAFKGRLKRLAERGAAGLITAEEQDREHASILADKRQRRGLPEPNRIREEETS